MTSAPPLQRGHWGLRRIARSHPIGARALLASGRRTDLGRSTSWPDVAALLVHEAPSGVGVDVFDTVVGRRVVGDAALWWVVGTSLTREGLWRGSVEEFVQARRAAAKSRPTGTLDDVYAARVLADRCHQDLGARTEHRVEEELTVPLAGAATALEQLRSAGHRLTFVSDMHLSRPHLWRLLVERQLAQPGEELIISSEVGAAKWDGTLFPRLRSDGPQGITWHVGNDLWSDVVMAERAGVRALPLRHGEPTQLERIMAGRAGSVGAAVAGAALSVRSGAAPSGPVADALHEVGVDVAGQCLSAFLLWIREQCQKLGIREVQFLARDGELPLRMAQAMPQDHWSGFHLAYLHGTRRLWSIAAAAALGVDTWMSAGTANARAFLRQGENDVPWHSLLERVVLTAADLGDHPHLAALPGRLPLPKEQTSAWHALLRDPRIRRVVARRAARRHADLVEYLRAQGIGDRPVAVVDVGWRGQLAWHISAVLRDVSGSEPVHLHFGGVDISAQEADQVDIRRFAVDDSRAPLPFADVISCVETFTASGAARAGSVARGADGTVRPVFEPALASMDTEHRQLMWAGAVALAGALPSRAVLEQWGLVGNDLADSVRAVLAQFWLRPTRRHALAGAHLAAEVDDAGAGVHTVARPYGLSRRARAGDRTWRQGSLALTAAWLRGPLTFVLRVRG